MVGAGLSVISTAVNEELKELGYAIHSLDQSDKIHAQKNNGAWTAGSDFTQQPVEESLKHLKKLERKVAARTRVMTTSMAGNNMTLCSGLDQCAATDPSAHGAMSATVCRTSRQGS